jgi:hypothetical protein
MGESRFVFGPSILHAMFIPIELYSRELGWTILIDPQIMFNIQNLINFICVLITIVHLNKFISAHLNINKYVQKNSPKINV